MIICPNCDTKLPNGARFCLICGAKVDAEETSGNKDTERKLKGLSKLKSMFKAEPLDAEPEPEVIKPEVETLPMVSEAVALQLPVLQECAVCQGEIPAGEIFIRCYCELITHVECVYDEQVCPQCGKELDLELLLPKDYKKKKVPKKPTIYKVSEREIEELIPPSTSYFVHIPQITREEDVKEFISAYFDKQDLGESTETENVSEVDMFISVDAAKKMLDHCYKHGREKEVMGLILGETYKFENKVFSIAKDVATSDLDANLVNVKFKSFEKLFKHLDQVPYEYQIIGWYHSHPGHSCFMSSIDVDTQQRMFKHPHQCAIVIDPINYDMKAFALDQKKKDEVKESGFAIVDYSD